jgi:mannose-1-phosphate guanylyltransferase
MKLILLSGGSGKRLWPLSNDARSKQFLKVLQDKQNENISMVQRVWKQLNEVGLSSSTYIATSKTQVETLYNQLGAEVNLVVEPARRDTFPAIALAASYLFSIEQVDLDEVVAVLPVDPFVHESFFHKITELERVIQLSQADLALIGVKPTYPSSKYGYIVPKVDSEEIFYSTVSHFKEKPNEKEAEKLIYKNALWNCGVFGFKLGYLINLLISKGLPTDYNELINNYNDLPKNSFDYEVVENTKKIVSVEYDGYWKDLGTWNTLTEEMNTSIIGKGIMSEDTKDTHVLNELDIPIACLGVSNLVVAASPDGILVSQKTASPRIKEIIGGFNERPMYEERRWGWYKVMDYCKTDLNEEILTKKVCITTGSNLSYHYHEHRDETWSIIKGEGFIALNDKILPINKGDTFRIPAGTFHAIKASQEIQMIEIQSGPCVIEEDINRLEINWSNIEKKITLV